MTTDPSPLPSWAPPDGPDPDGDPAPDDASRPRAADIAVVGDVHLQWDAEDAAYFRDAPYACVLFVGDLAGYSHRGGLGVARSIAGLGRRALVLPGNHDGIHVGQLVAEVVRERRLARLLDRGQERRCAALRAALGDATLCGYSLHHVATAVGPLGVVAARPHSMGGSYIAYEGYIGRRFGVRSVEASARCLQSLVDRCPHERLLFLAHCGPTGLGAGRADIWGCDFKAEEGDWGDEDLRRAIAHARGRGKQVLAVIAGHMHHAVKNGGRRPWSVEHDGVLYVNAARVPRIFRDGEDVVRHHVALRITGKGARAVEVLRRMPDGAHAGGVGRGAASARVAGAIAAWLVRRGRRAGALNRPPPAPPRSAAASS